MFTHALPKFLCVSFLTLALTACSGGGGGGGGSPAGPPKEGPEKDLPPVSTEICIDERLPKSFDRETPQEKLAKSIRTGDAPCVRYAIKLGARPNEKIDTDLFPRGNNMEYPIIYAMTSTPLFFAREGNIGVIRALADNGADLNVTGVNNRNMTPLQMALTEDTLSRFTNPAVYLISTKKVNFEFNGSAGNTYLVDMLLRGKTDLALMLIKAGASIQARSREGLNTLQISSKSSAFEDISILLLNKGIDPNATDSMGDTALHSSVRVRTDKLTNALIAKNVAKDIQNNNRETALLLAVQNGSTVAAKVLIVNGADVNLASNKEAPIHAALRSGNDELSNLLIAKISDVNVLDNNQSSPLHLAVGSSSAARVRDLVDRGADGKKTDRQGYTPLMLALHTKKTDKALAVLNVSDVNQKGLDGKTAVFFTATPADIEMLLNRGANVNATSENGHTPLAQAVLSNRSEIASFLIEKGADLSWRSSNKDSLLHVSVQNDDLAVAKQLIERRVDVNSRNVKEETPIFNVRSVAMVDYLVQSRADLNRVSLDGNFVLSKKLETYMFTDSRDAYPVVERLVKLGANVKAKVRSSTTLLHMAVSLGRGFPDNLITAENALVSLLIDAGAQVNARDNKGNTALHLADTESEIRQLLLAQADRKLENNRGQTATQVKINEESEIKLKETETLEQIATIEEQLKKATKGGAVENRLNQQLAQRKATLNMLNRRLEEVRAMISVLG